jgi:ABC-type uncharacterized transport system permease subunit
MKGWRVAGILVAAILLGALAYVALDRQVYEQGINLNLKLLAVIGGLLVISAVLFIALRRKKAD